MSESILEIFLQNTPVGEGEDMFESDTQLCHNMTAFMCPVNTDLCLSMARLTLIINYSGELHETINKNNLAQEESSQLFVYITVERLKMYGI